MSKKVDHWEDLRQLVNQRVEDYTTPGKHSISEFFSWHRVFIQKVLWILWDFNQRLKKLEE